MAWVVISIDILFIIACLVILWLSARWKKGHKPAARILRWYTYDLAIVSMMVVGLISAIERSLNDLTDLSYSAYSAASILSDIFMIIADVFVLGIVAIPLTLTTTKRAGLNTKSLKKFQWIVISIVAALFASQEIISCIMGWYNVMERSNDLFTGVASASYGAYLCVGIISAVVMKRGISRVGKTGISNKGIKFWIYLLVAFLLARSIANLIYATYGLVLFYLSGVYLSLTALNFFLTAGIFFSLLKATTCQTWTEDTINTRNGEDVVESTFNGWPVLFKDKPMSTHGTEVNPQPAVTSHWLPQRPGGNYQPVQQQQAVELQAPEIVGYPSMEPMPQHVPQVSERYPAYR